MGNWCSQTSIESYRDYADDFYDMALKRIEKYGGEFKDKSKADILMLKGHFLLNYPENEELAWKTIEEAYAIQQELEQQRGISYSDIEFYRLCAEAYGFVKQDKEKALTYYTKALETAISIYGENHPETAKIYESMGRYYANRTDDIDKAIEYFNKGIDICRNLLIERSLLAAKCYLHLAGCYKMKGESVLSDQYLEKANKMLENLGLKVAYSN